MKREHKQRVVCSLKTIVLVLPSQYCNTKMMCHFVRVRIHLGKNFLVGLTLYLLTSLQRTAAALETMYPPVVKYSTQFPLDRRTR